MSEAKPEKIRLKGHTIKEILDDEFLEKLKNNSGDGKIFPIATVFVNEFLDDEERDAEMISLNHESAEEIEDKILHIESSDPELVETVRKIFEGDK